MREIKIMIMAAGMAALLISATGAAFGTQQQLDSGKPNSDSVYRYHVEDASKISNSKVVTGTSLPSVSVKETGSETDAKKTLENGKASSTQPRKGKGPSGTGDTLAPTVSASPVGGLYGSEQSILLVANEPATIYYSIDGTNPSTSSAVYSSEVQVSSTATLKYFAKDVAGNVGAISTQEYTIDVNPPFIEITQPTQGSQVTLGSGNFVVVGKASDVETSVTSVQVSMDSGSPLLAEPAIAGDWSSWSAELIVSPGSHSVTARAIDGFGRESSHTIQIEVALQPAPEPDPPAEDDLPEPLKTINVATIQELMAAANVARPGDHIVMKAGIYDTTPYFAANNVNRLLITVDGTATNPIVIRADAAGSVELTGPSSFYLNGASHVIIYGLKFTHSQDNSALTDDIALRCHNCEGVRFSHNVFALTTEFTNLAADVDKYHSDWLGITGMSSNNRVDHNEFRDKYTRGVFLFLFGQNGIVVQNTLVDHNLFSGQLYQHGNGGECFRIGNSALGNAPGNMVMEYNTFEHCDGDREAITIKASNNIIRYNTFRNNEGSLTFRHGNANTADGNIFIDGNNGIRVYGHDHRIVNNYFANNPMTVSSLLAPIVIGKGTVESDLSTSNSEHSQPRNILIAHNTLVNNQGGIVIGYGDEIREIYLPQDIVVVNNIITATTGRLVSVLAGDVTFGKNILYPSNTAVMGHDQSDDFLRTDPLLTIGTDGISRPSRTSPAIDRAASPTYGITTDMDGQPRLGKFDIGADEVV
jgi:chondroitinase B-like protein/chitobiase/beta-hexosaminidase-like protein/Big-like domain-containing protein